MKSKSSQNKCHHHHLSNVCENSFCMFHSSWVISDYHFVWQFEFPWLNLTNCPNKWMVIRNDPVTVKHTKWIFTDVGKVMMIFILATDFDFIAYMSKMASFFFGSFLHANGVFGMMYIYIYIYIFFFFFFFLNPCEYHMDLCNESWSASWPAGWLSCMAKTFDIGHYTQTFQPIVFIPAMVIGIGDSYQFIPLSLVSVTMTFAEGQRKANLLASLSCTLFNWSAWNLIWSWSNSNWTSHCYVWVREITAV